ncbi:MAG: hypothetical protein R2939_20385 [Kofleriaceae bacterium]
MMKLGELLVRLGRITAAQLEAALKSQVMYGGRLGTNVVEVSNIDLDDLAQAIGRQHQCPAALQAHFEQSDPELQARFKRFLAARWECVPLARLADDSGRIAIALAEPVPAHAMQEIAEALGTRPEQLVVGLAAELRIRYHLERVYGIDREPRFLRVRGGQLPEIPAVPDGASGSDADLEIPLDEADLVEEPATAEVPDEAPGLAGGTGLVPPPPTRRPVTLPPPIPGDASTERRRFVQPMGAEAPTPTPTPTPKAPAGEEINPRALGRLAIKRIAVGGGGAAAAGPAAPATLADSLKAIRRGKDRDVVGDHIVAALRTHAEASIDSAGILVVRGAVAIGWKGFSRGADLAFETVVVPLDQPGLLAAAHKAGVPQRTEVGKRPPAAIDRDLFATMAGPAPAYVIVSPVKIGEQVVCLVYAQGHGAMGLAAEVADGVAGAATAAFTRLMRAAQR